MRRLFFYSFLFLLSTGAYAQLVSPDKIRSLTTDDGLPQSYINSILQDNKGFMWISTLDGLGRYDGHSFRNFRHDETNPASLAYNIIFRATFDRDHHLWLQYENRHTDIFDPVTEKARHLSLEPEFAWLAPANLRNYSVYQDTTGRIYTMCFDKDAAKRKLRYFTWKNTHPTDIELPRGEAPIDMYLDSLNNLWVAGSKYLYVITAHHQPTRIDTLPAGLKVYQYPQGYENYYTMTMLKAGELFYADPLESWTYVVGTHHWQKIVLPADIHGRDKVLKTASDGSLYLFNRKAVYRMDKDQNFSPVWFNDSKYAYTFWTIDRSDVIWIGTNTFGIKLINLNRSGFVSHYDIYSSVFDLLPQLYQLPFNEGSRGENFLYMGYLSRWAVDKYGSQWYVNLPFPNIGGKALTRSSITTLSKGKATVVNLNVKTKANLPAAISNLAFDDHNRCWALIDSGVLVNADVINSHIISSTKIVPDGQEVAYMLAVGDKLCLVYNDQLQFYDPQTRQSVFYKNQPGLASFHNVTFLMAAHDPIRKNILWLATRGGGLIKFDFENITATALTENNGLPNNTVYAIVPDKHGFLWCSSNKGIFRFNPADNTALSFVKKDGLQGNEFNRYQFLSLPDGHIAFGGTNGETIFHPDSITHDKYKPQIAITGISVNNNELSVYDNKAAPYQDSLHLNYDKNFLTFHFAGMEFNDPDKIKYRYMLEGADKKWNDTYADYVNYSNLQPGSYTFKVYASNTSGIWSNQLKTVYVYISPPWWRSWLAYICYFILLAMGIWQWMKFMGHRASLQAQLQFEQAESKRAQELDMARTQFYTNISHEFRTPLTVILGMARKVAEDHGKYLKSGTNLIINNGQNLLRLVNEMLDLSKLQSGKMTLDNINGDIIAFLRYMVESFHSLADNQNKRFHFLTKLHYYYTGYDEEKMRQIISNLLSNAVKFTPAGGDIYISLTLNEVAANSNEAGIVITVTDTGIGIPEDKLPLIFDRFYQVDIGTTRTTQGTGIGLSLTRELVKLMKGEISVKSPPPGALKGTEFIIELPLSKLPPTDEPIIRSPVFDHQYSLPAENSRRKPATTAANNNAPLILVAEDNADVVSYIALCLADYRLAVAQDGVEGFELARELIPDLIISDVMMPRMDGFGLLQKIKEHETTSHIPIIMLTAKADKESKMEGISRGADAYLEKPFNNDELLLHIKKLLELRAVLQKFYLKNAGLADAKNAEPEVVENTATNVLEIEDRFVKKVRLAIETNLADETYSVEQLSTDVFMSQSNLRRKLDALTGCSPNKFIRVVRLKKAKELLGNPNKSIYEVALECGFSDRGYFSRVFKQEFGVTPNEWRS